MIYHGLCRKLARQAHDEEGILNHGLDALDQFEEGDYKL